MSDSEDSDIDALFEDENPSLIDRWAQVVARDIEPLCSPKDEGARQTPFIIILPNMDKPSDDSRRGFRVWAVSAPPCSTHFAYLTKMLYPDYRNDIAERCDFLVRELHKLPPLQATPDTDEVVESYAMLDAAMERLVRTVLPACEGRLLLVAYERCETRQWIVRGQLGTAAAPQHRMVYEFLQHEESNGL